MKETKNIAIGLIIRLVIVVILGAGLLNGLKHTKKNKETFTELLKEKGYIDIEYLHRKRLPKLYFKCESRPGIKIIGASHAMAVKNGGLRKVTICFSSLSAFIFDPEEVPTGVLVINKEKALEIYKEVENEAAVKVVNDYNFIKVN